MKVVASSRQLQGSSASRRLRRSAKVPGIIYGGNSEPTKIELDHNPLYHALRVEAFHASILDMELDGKPERVLLRDVQWHPYKPVVQHIDFQRVAADQKIVLKVPLHFTNAEASPAVKLSSMTACAYSCTAVPSSAPSLTLTTTTRPESVPKSIPTTNSSATWSSSSTGPPPARSAHPSSRSRPVFNDVEP
mgnify:CR=1 FL=1